MHDVNIAYTESETEADLKAFDQSVAKRKYLGHSEAPTKRRRLSAGDDDDSVTESDDDNSRACPRFSLFAYSGS